MAQTLILRPGQPPENRNLEPEEMDFLETPAEQQERVKEQRTQSIKKEASRRILENYPFHTQINMTAESSELQEIRIENGELSPEQQARRQELLNVWDQIKAIRTRSNEIEGSLDSLTAAQVSEFVESEQSHWD